MNNRIKDWIVSNVFAIIGLIGGIASLWFFYKITPLVSRLDKMEDRLINIEKNVELIPTTYMRSDVYQQQYASLCEKLDNLTLKLDKLTDAINQLYREQP